MYLFNELASSTSKAQRGYASDSVGRDAAMGMYKNGSGEGLRIDVDSLDFSGLKNEGWDGNDRQTFTFRNRLDYGVHGTVTIQKIDSATFSVLPETYNNDHKESLGVLHPRNIATAINRGLHGAGKPFEITFDGARRFDNLGRRQ